MSQTRELMRAIETERAGLEPLRLAADTARDSALQNMAIEVPDDASEDQISHARTVALIANPDAFADVDAAYLTYDAQRERVDVMQVNLMRLFEMQGTAEGDYADAQNDNNKNLEAQRMSLLGLAHRFTGSEGYANMAKIAASKSRGFTSDAVPFASVSETLALLQPHRFAIEGLPSTEAGAFVTPDRQEYVSLLFQEPTISGIVGLGTTDSDLVEWVEETVFTNAAASVAENASAAESAITWAVRNAPVEEKAHFMQATKRALADAGEVRGLIDQHLVDGLSRVIEAAVISDDGTTPNWKGIANTTGVLTYDKAVADSLLDAIHKGMTLVRIQHGRITHIALHPTSYQSIRLSKDTAGLVPSWTRRRRYGWPVGFPACADYRSHCR